MAADGVTGNAITGPYPTCLESVNRFSKLPVVDSTIKTATSLYGKVKDLNGLTHWTLSTAETTLCKAVDLGKPLATPVIKNFEGGIKKVDNVLCSGLDYVEEKLPAVKLPAGEIYNTTKDYVSNTVTPAVETAKSYAEPAYERAKSAVEPAVERARNIVEPYVQPALDTAQAIKENVMHKVDEYLHHSHSDGEVVECKECKEIRAALEEQQRKEQEEQQHKAQQPGKKGN